MRIEQFGWAMERMFKSCLVTNAIAIADSPKVRVIPQERILGDKYGYGGS
jgi:hypothetical protein